MDLGIKGKWALVCGASKGLGLGCAQALAAEGVNLLIVARGAEALGTQSAMNLESCSRSIKTGAEVLFCAQDITTVEPAVRPYLPCARTLTLWSPTRAARRPAISVTGTARPGSKAVDANMLTPIELIKATVDGMAARGFRAHCEHHFQRGEVAHRHSGPVQRRAQWTDRLCGRRGPQQPGRQGRDHQQPACPASSTPTALPPQSRRRRRRRAKAWTTFARRSKRRFPWGGMARRRSLGRSVPSCAASRRGI